MCVVGLCVVVLQTRCQTPTERLNRPVHYCALNARPRPCGQQQQEEDGDVGGGMVVVGGGGRCAGAGEGGGGGAWQHLGVALITRPAHSLLAAATRAVAAMLADAWKHQRRQEEL